MSHAEEYAEAVERLLKAAYAAIHACRDTTYLPHVDRRALRLIAKEAQRLVDQGEESGQHDSIISTARLDGEA